MYFRRFVIEALQYRNGIRRVTPTYLLTSFSKLLLWWLSVHCHSWMLHSVQKRGSHWHLVESYFKTICGMQVFFVSVASLLAFCNHTHLEYNNNKYITNKFQLSGWHVFHTHRLAISTPQKNCTYNGWQWCSRNAIRLATFTSRKCCIRNCGEPTAAKHLFPN